MGLAAMVRAVPDIDLEPHEYADRDPKSGKWRRPLSKRAAKWWFVFCAVFLGVATLPYLGGAPITWSSLGLTAFLAFFAGVFAQQWLRDIY